MGTLSTMVGSYLQPPSVRYSMCGSLTGFGKVTIEMEPIGPDGSVYPTTNIFSDNYTIQISDRFGCGVIPNFYDIDFAHPLPTTARVRASYRTDDGHVGFVEKIAPVRASNLILPPRVVVNEFRSRGPNGVTDQFIELFNGSVTASPAGSVVIGGPSFSGTTVPILATTIGPGCHYLLTAPGYSGTVPGDAPMPAVLMDSGVVIRYAAVHTSIYVQADEVSMNGRETQEGAPLAPFPGDNVDRSYTRLGPDTNVNARDFVLRTGSTPQNSTMCGSR